jgi:hypothetical protein
MSENVIDSENSSNTEPGATHPSASGALLDDRSVRIHLGRPQTLRNVQRKICKIWGGRHSGSECLCLFFNARLGWDHAADSCRLSLRRVST